MQMGEYSCVEPTLIALADPTGRGILARLGGGEGRVTDIAAPFPISLNSVSKHIRILERADLVRRRKRGREYLLALNPKPLDAAVKWMEEQPALSAFRLADLPTALPQANP